MFPIARRSTNFPLSFVCDEQLTVIRRRSDIETRCVARGRLTATADAWCVEASLTAFENDIEVFERTWSQDIERDHQWTPRLHEAATSRANSVLGAS